jgi:hypothetical protein
MKGVLRFKIDYGYCSIDCVTQDKAPCLKCGQALKMGEDEKICRYIERRFCSLNCAASFFASQKKSEETKKKMSKAQRNRSPEIAEKITKSRAKFYAGEGGTLAKAKSVNGFRSWRESNPEQAAEMVRKQTESRKNRGVYANNSQRMTIFFQTPEGEAQKKKFSDLYSGKPRPLHVTQQMKDSLRKFWDSDEGIKLREEISYNRTDGLDNVPYGPGWDKMAAKVRQRDGCCIICSKTKAELDRELDVHHIYARRRFFYTPGVNRNYLWANHLANLITLCQTCHRKVEMNTLSIPALYQELADRLWQEFLTKI